MLFAWIGFIKRGAEMIPPDVNVQTSDFLQQPFIRIHSGGPLCDEDQRRAGMLMIFEADDRTAAEALVADSPYQKAGLYERHHLYEYRNEVG
ncbi:MAG: YciI family protein [Sphingomonas sp.]